jgi:hypothetical protein
MEPAGKSAGRLRRRRCTRAGAFRPQWSQPVIGGTTLRSLVTASRQCILPQWSPPPTGGNTCHGEALLGHGDVAAMEPAAERREPSCHLCLACGWRRAAMEPARDRREHVEPDRRRHRNLGTPQWSPPNGESAFSRIARSSCGVMPQWSPLVIGGTTHRLLLHRANHRLAAMEPAGNRRNDRHTRLAASLPRTSRYGARR